MTTRLQQIKERESKATKGPWSITVGHLGENNEFLVTFIINREQTICLQPKVDEDGEFIAQSRADIPWLIERIEEARELIDRAFHRGPYAEFIGTEWDDKAEQFLRETE